MEEIKKENMTRCIVAAFHKYTPFGDEFYEPILSFFLQQMEKYKDEYDTLYLIDSTWNINPATYNLPPNVIIIKVSPHLRYYDAYKEVLPQIKEDLVLFMDNDMVVYKKGRIEAALSWLKKYDVVSIYDTIGDTFYPQLNGKSKFCPYWFATRKDLLMKYRDCDWGPNMPVYETLGGLTEAMLADGIKPWEWEEDKSSIYCNGDKVSWNKENPEFSGLNFGYYHIRAGSTPAYLLATKAYGDKKTYWDYIEKQPKQEYLRQCAWYQYMGGDVSIILQDAEVKSEHWDVYMEVFRKYHGLE